MPVLTEESDGVPQGAMAVIIKLRHSETGEQLVRLWGALRFVEGGRRIVEQRAEQHGLAFGFLSKDVPAVVAGGAAHIIRYPAMAEVGGSRPIQPRHKGRKGPWPLGPSAFQGSGGFSAGCFHRAEF